ncbi:hypothetical protein BJX61DRAFT_537261 [Aspergillus egyptiacus]|nr:hypothetical protein BJX61DRAFT_537261 [Aspergillus egyptiacus]
MHLTNLLVASVMALAPAVNGYSVATVEIGYHEACVPGQFPKKSVDASESTLVTEDICAHLPAKHSFDIDAYSFQVTTITKEAAHDCHAVAVHTNEECTGFPLTVIPLFPGEKEEKFPCLPDEYFEETVSLRLVCGDGDREYDDDHRYDDDGDDAVEDLMEGDDDVQDKA